MVSAARLSIALSKPFMPAVFFFAGVTYDTITLTRIDRLLDNLILLIYLTVLGLLIVLTGRAAMRRPEVMETPAEWWTMPGFLVRTKPYYPNAIQFLLGGLFSAYTIFYLQSASFTSSAVFFGVLVAFLVANEFLRDRLSSMKLLVSLYAVVCFSFFTYFIPVLVRFMNTFVFLLGAILSLGVTLWVVEQIYKETPQVSKKDKVMTGLPAGVLVGVLIGFYFLNWIPPVPLSLKFGGIYHQVSKSDGTYQLGFEKAAWYEFWKRSDDPFLGEGPVYCFTAVFAPVDLQTNIYHRWQYRATNGAGERRYLTSDRIQIPISGGREGGYRTYTRKKHMNAGYWRVNVETEEGRLIGRVEFEVEQNGRAATEIDSITY
jgi:hypothetical protein